MQDEKKGYPSLDKTSENKALPNKKRKTKDASIFVHSEDTIRIHLNELFMSSIQNKTTFSVQPGSDPMTQFEPWYFGVAFAFAFKFCIGMPDMPEDKWAFARYRRTPEAPRIEQDLWIRTITRRIESQLRRNWLLGFTLGSYDFQSRLNLSKTLFIKTRIEDPDTKHVRDVTAKDVELAAINICKALQGTYTTTKGKKREGQWGSNKAAVCHDIRLASEINGTKHASRIFKYRRDARSTYINAISSSSY